VKVNNGPTGHVLLYHQTARPAGGATRPDAQAIEPTLPFLNLVMRNNIWESNRYVIEQDDAAQVEPVAWDRNLLWTHDVEGAGRYVKWLGVRYASQTALAASGTIETRSMQAAPAYVDAAAGDFTPVVGHPVVDAGDPIPGINDRTARGTGPDIGAIERDDPAAPLATVRRSDVAAELPAAPDATFTDVIFPWTDSDSVITNPALPALLFYLADPPDRVLRVERATDTVRLDWAP
jgi:hypothetical protein